MSVSSSLNVDRSADLASNPCVTRRPQSHPVLRPRALRQTLSHPALSPCVTRRPQFHPVLRPRALRQTLSHPALSPWVTRRPQSHLLNVPLSCGDVVAKSNAQNDCGSATLDPRLTSTGGWVIMGATLPKNAYEYL